MIDEHLRAADDEDRLKVGEEFEEWLWIVFLTCSHARKQFAHVKTLLTKNATTPMTLIMHVLTH